MHTSIANKGPLITTSGFAVYDHCLNTYVGCQFGCTYCYVRFYLKDKNHSWGQWVRMREHIRTRLHGEITTTGSTRLIMGTMTDPYQPIEGKARLTRAALQILASHPVQMRRVGIWTRSPMVIQDAKLIARLPDPWVHITVTPFDQEAKRLLEPIPVSTEARFRTAKILKENGIHVAIAVSPVLPILGDHLRESILQQIRDIGIDEFQVDPLLPYGAAMDTLVPAIQTHPRAAEIISLINDKNRYKRWKSQELATWTAEWKKNPVPQTLALGIDHATKEKFNMATGERLPWDHRP